MTSIPVEPGWHDSGGVFSELLTAHRIQHPTGHSDLHLITQFDDEAVGRGAPEPTDDLYGFAVKGVVTVVNDG